LHAPGYYGQYRLHILVAKLGQKSTMQIGTKQETRMFDHAVPDIFQPKKRLRFNFDVYLPS
jgi:hypothetical protein